MTTSELETSSKVRKVFSRFNTRVAASLFVVALLSIWVFQSIVHINPFGASNANYFTYQAESFLHGRWDLISPLKGRTSSMVHGKHYIVYPPMPAVVLMPFVAIFGLNTSDILFTAVCSALNLGLLYLLLEQVRGVASPGASGWRTWASAYSLVRVDQPVAVTGR